jgi:glycosyltransferase involved in cell wall biosynthesis
VRVGFGVTVLAKGLAGSGCDGIGHYTKELYEALRSNGGVDLLPYSYGCPLPTSALDASVSLLESYPRSLVRDGLSLSRQRWRCPPAGPVDLIHATDHLIPWVQGIPLVATLMDAIPLSNPEWISPTARLKAKVWRMLARRADHIITISEYSKSQIIEYFGIREEKISAIPLGVNPIFFQPIDLESRQTVCRRYGINGKFFLNIGTLQPRKNVGRILEAMRLLPDGIRRTRQLIIVGKNGWETEDLVAEIRRAESEGWCKWLGFVPDDDVRALLQSAEAFVFPSLNEGFGLPILEAFASRTPVITSNTTVLREAGDFALCIDPEDIEQIALAITSLVESHPLRQALIERGAIKAQQAFWRETANATLSVYKQLNREGRPRKF